MANNSGYRWRVAVQADGTYAYLRVGQSTFTGFGGIAITEPRVTLDSLSNCKISDNPGDRGLFLYALAQEFDIRFEVEFPDDSSFDDCDDQYRRIVSYWAMQGKPTADCDEPDVDVPWFPWEDAGYTRQEALRTVVALCYSSGGDNPKATEKLKIFGVSAAEIEASRAAIEAEEDAKHAEWLRVKRPPQSLSIASIEELVISALAVREADTDPHCLHQAQEAHAKAIANLGPSKYSQNVSVLTVYESAQILQTPNWLQIADWAKESK